MSKIYSLFITCFVCFLSLLIAFPCHSALGLGGEMIEEFEMELRSDLMYLGTFYVSSKGHVLNTLILESDERYMFTVSQSVLYEHSGFPRIATLDACYEHGINERNPRLMPSVKNNVGQDLCSSGYQADHVYVSGIFRGNDSPLSFQMVDITFENNTGMLKVQIFRVKDEEVRRSNCTCWDRFGGGIEFVLMDGAAVIEWGLGFSECNNLTRTHPRCR